MEQNPRDVIGGGVSGQDLGGGEGGGAVKNPGFTVRVSHHPLDQDSPSSKM